MGGDEPRLTRECTAFCRYLAGVTPTPYIQQRYRSGYPPTQQSVAPIDRWLTGLALIVPGGVRSADAYARIFCPRGAFRRKLILLAAVLESSPGTQAYLNGADTGPAWQVLLGLAWTSLCSIAALLFGALACGPVHLGLVLLGRKGNA